jgi:hypothetical protein
MIDFDLEDPIVEPIIKEYLLRTSFQGIKDLSIIEYEIRVNGVIVNLNVYAGLQPTTTLFFLDDSFFEEKIIPEIRERKLNQLLDGNETTDTSKLG